MEDFKFREMIKAAEKIRNHQNEWSSLLEAHKRLPVGLQGAVMDRMQALGNQLIEDKQQYPINFPRGTYPGYKKDAKLRRGIS